jgi:predicted GIY-YIG superfamily endonuclease
MPKTTSRERHSVYVVRLDVDGKQAYYVGITGLTPEQRFENHKRGIKAARVVRRYGVALVPELYAHLNPMSWEKAVEAEPELADQLRRRGCQVYGGH